MDWGKLWQPDKHFLPRQSCMFSDSDFVNRDRRRRKKSYKKSSRPTYLSHMTFQLTRRQESRNNTNIYEPISLGVQRRSHSMLLNISLVSSLPLSEGRFCAVAGLNSSVSRAWRLERMLAFSSHVPWDSLITRRTCSCGFPATTLNLTCSKDP